MRNSIVAFTFVKPHFLRWGILQGKWGQKKSISHLSKTTPFPKEAANLHREIIYYDKFDIVTHLKQITYFDSFQGNLGVEWGSKRSKIGQLVKKLPAKTKGLHRHMDIFHEKFGVVTYYLHTTTF